MKKFILIALALLAFVGQAFADVQIDEGQLKGAAAPIKFFVGRYGRTGNIGTEGAFSISKDRVVVWDSTSADGMTVTTTTTSHDALVIGVTMEETFGSSRDNTAANDAGNNNWGRIQTWGLHTGVSFDVNALRIPIVGDKVSTGNLRGRARIFKAASEDNTTVLSHTSASNDNFGVVLDNSIAAGDKTVDIFINR